MFSIFKAISFVFIFTLSCSSVSANWRCANWQDAIQAFSVNGKDDDIASIIGGGKKYGIHKRTANADETEFLAKSIIEIAHQRPDNPFHDRTDTHLAKFIEPFKAIDLTALEADDAKGLREHLGCVAAIYHITVAADQVVDEVYQHLTFGAHDNFGDLSREGFIKRVEDNLLKLKVKLQRDPFFQPHLAGGLALYDSYLNVTNLALRRVLIWYEQALQAGERYWECEQVSKDGKYWPIRPLKQDEGWQMETERLLAKGVMEPKKVNGFRVVQNRQKEVIAIIKPERRRVGGRILRDINREALNYRLVQKAEFGSIVAENFIATPIPGRIKSYERSEVSGPGSVLVERFHPYADKKVLRNMLVAGGYDNLRYLLQKDTLARFIKIVGRSPLLGNQLNLHYIKTFKNSARATPQEREKVVGSVPFLSTAFGFDGTRGIERLRMLIAAYFLDYMDGRIENIVISLAGSRPSMRWVNTQCSHGKKPRIGFRGGYHIRIPAVLGFRELQRGIMTSGHWPELGRARYSEDMERLFAQYGIDSGPLRKASRCMIYVRDAHYYGRHDSRLAGLTMAEAARKVILNRHFMGSAATKHFVRELYRVLAEQTNIIKIARLFYFVNRKREEFPLSFSLWKSMEDAV